MFLNWSFRTHEKKFLKEKIYYYFFLAKEISHDTENWDFWTRLFGDSEYFN